MRYYLLNIILSVLVVVLSVTFIFLFIQKNKGNSIVNKKTSITTIPAQITPPTIPQFQVFNEKPGYSFRLSNETELKNFVNKLSGGTGKMELFGYPGTDKWVSAFSIGLVISKQDAFPVSGPDGKIFQSFGYDMDQNNHHATIKLYYSDKVYSEFEKFNFQGNRLDGDILGSICLLSQKAKEGRDACDKFVTDYLKNQANPIFKLSKTTAGLNIFSVLNRLLVKEVAAAYCDGDFHCGHSTISGCYCNDGSGASCSQNNTECGTSGTCAGCTINCTGWEGSTHACDESIMGGTRGVCRDPKAECERINYPDGCSGGTPTCSNGGSGGPTVTPGGPTVAPTSEPYAMNCKNLTVSDGPITQNSDGSYNLNINQSYTFAADFDYQKQGYTTWGGAIKGEAGTTCTDILGIGGAGTPISGTHTFTAAGDYRIWCLSVTAGYGACSGNRTCDTGANADCAGPDTNKTVHVITPPGRIQGIRVSPIGPPNGTVTTISVGGVVSYSLSNNGDAYSTEDSLLWGSSYTVSAPVISGYNTSYSECDNCTDHSDAGGHPFVTGSSVNVTIPSTAASGYYTAYVDLWWQFTPINPDCATNFSWSCAGSTATISWKAPTNTPLVSSYIVRLNHEPYDPPDHWYNYAEGDRSLTTSTTSISPTVEIGANYRYDVQPVTSDGVNGARCPFTTFKCSATPTPPTITPIQPTPTPTIVAPTLNQPTCIYNGNAVTGISLTWSDNSTNEDGFKIAKKTGAGGWVLPETTLGAGITSRNDYAVVSGTTYQYYVRAFIGSPEINGADSATRTITCLNYTPTPTVPEPTVTPGNCTISGKTPTSGCYQNIPSLSASASGIADKIQFAVDTDNGFADPWSCNSGWQGSGSYSACSVTGTGTYYWGARSSSTTGACVTSSLLPPYTLTIDQSAPNVPSPTFSSSCPSTLTLSWPAVSDNGCFGSVQYWVQIGNVNNSVNGDGSLINANKYNGWTSSTSVGITPTSGETYYAVVKTSDNGSSHTNQSAFSSVVQKYFFCNTAPSCGTITHTGSNVQGGQLTMTAPGSDPDSSQTLTYSWTSGCGGGYEATFPNGLTTYTSTKNPPGSSVVTPINLPDANVACIINADVSDGAGGSDNCTGDSFTISCPSIPIPTLSSPADNICTNSDPISLSASGVTNYQFAVDDENGFASPWLRNSGWNTSGNYTISPSLLTTDNYYWSARSKTSDTCVGNLASPRTLNIDKTASNVPSGLIPTCNVNGSVSASWNAAADNGCKGLHSTPYWAQASTDPTFATAYNVSPWLNTWTSGITKSTGAGAFSPGVTVYTRVRSRDGFDQQSGWSTNVSCIVPTNGACSDPDTHYHCSAGTSADNGGDTATWTWNCDGLYGGTNAPCSEYKPPTCTISANPSTVDFYSASTIAWSSANTASCSVSPPGWTGTSGSKSTGNLTSATNTYTGSCTGPGGSITCSTTVTVRPPPVPTLTCTTHTNPTSITWNWTTSPGPLTYFLQVWDDTWPANGWYPGPPVTTDATPGIPYYGHVKAGGGGQSSPWSTPDVSCTVPALSTPTGACGSFNNLNCTTPVSWSWANGTGLQVWDNASPVQWWYNSAASSPQTFNSIPAGRTVYGRTTYVDEFSYFSSTANVTCPIPALSAPALTCGDFNNDGIPYTPVTATWTSGDALQVTRDLPPSTQADPNKWLYNAAATSPKTVTPSAGKYMPPGHIIYARTYYACNGGVFSATTSVTCPVPPNPSPVTVSGPLQQKSGTTGCHQADATNYFTIQNPTTTTNPSNCVATSCKALPSKEKAETYSCTTTFSNNDCLNDDPPTWPTSATVTLTGIAPPGYAPIGPLSGWTPNGSCDSPVNTKTVNAGDTINNQPLTFNFSGDNWMKLKNSSFNGVSVASITVPALVTSYDADDDGSKYFIIAPGSVAGLVLNTTVLPNSDPLKLHYSYPNNWYDSPYAVSSSMHPSDFLSYVKSRKEYQTISDLSSINKDGIYVWSGTPLDLNSVPPQFNSFKVVLIVSGMVNINVVDFSPTKSLALLANQIKFSNTTTKATGIFIANTVNTGTTTNQGLKIIGNLIAQTTLTNGRTWSDTSRPRLFIVFDPVQYINLLPYLSIANYEWRQIQ